MSGTAVLYRAVGLGELEAILESGGLTPSSSRAGGVPDRDRAEQRAREHHAGDPASGFAGFVLAWPGAGGPGPVQVVAAFFGPEYQGPEPGPTLLVGLGAAEQLEALSRMVEGDRADLRWEVAANWKLVAANYLFWRARSAPGDRVLAAIESAWREFSIDWPLPGQSVDVATAPQKRRLGPLGEVLATVAAAVAVVLLLVFVLVAVSWLFR